MREQINPFWSKSICVYYVRKFGGTEWNIFLGDISP